MLKKLINSAHISFKIAPLDPLLIKSGQATVGGTDMSFMRTYKFGEKEFPFIPGSSIKGMLRAYAEKICRTLGDNKVPVCLPYIDSKKNDLTPDEKAQAACGLRVKEKDKEGNKSRTIISAKMYNISCPVCRLFGSHKYIGRLATSDAYLTKESEGQHRLEIRDGIAIDRLTGGTAGGAKYDFEVLTKGDFETSVDIRNFERWQLGLIGLVFRDMEDGLIRIGFGKSRGLGKIKAEIKNFKIISYNMPLRKLSGIVAHCTEQEKQSYGFFTETNGGEDTPWPECEKKGLRHEYTITELWKNLLEPAVNDLVQFVRTDKWPQKIDEFVAEVN
ncbi:MAG: CRISPR-associated RAMP protein [Planctomycetes bacterium]|nr:CRISPR-associated RAMP protein [Planctomycetota bacterium]